MQSPYHTEFMLERVVGDKVEVLILVGHFSVEGDFERASWLSHCVSVQKCQHFILLPLSGELDVWLLAVQMQSVNT